MESFLASDPDLFSPVRTVIKWVDGHYDGKSLYRSRIDRASCDNSPRGLWKFLGSEEVSVSYEFSLKSSSVALFAGALRVGDLRKGFRLPIGSAVGWLVPLRYLLLHQGVTSWVFIKVFFLSAELPAELPHVA